MTPRALTREQAEALLEQAPALAREWRRRIAQAHAEAQVLAAGLDMAREHHTRVQEIDVTRADALAKRLRELEAFCQQGVEPEQLTEAAPGAVLAAAAAVEAATADTLPPPPAVPTVPEQGDVGAELLELEVRALVPYVHALCEATPGDELLEAVRNLRPFYAGVRAVLVAIDRQRARAAGATP